MTSNVQWAGTARKVKAAMAATLGTGAAITSAQALGIAFLANLIVTFGIASPAVAAIVAETVYTFAEVALPAIAALAAGYLTPEPSANVRGLP